MKLPNFWHVLDGDEITGTRRGILIRRFDGRVAEVSLLLSVRGWGKRLMFTDFRQAVAHVRPEYWLRVGLDLWYGVDVECGWGVQPDSRAKLELSTKPVRLYQVKP